jgi:hypothetical protein
LTSAAEAADAIDGVGLGPFAKAESSMAVPVKVALAAAPR